ncbi:exopolysaccharide biosynthesis protein [Thalassospira australica]|uniref:exopolysaccharide biosynthesis protein n=1 Tax=Thalassospira australica TaxID=1528106 RepID=UPI00384DFD7D
MTDAEPVSVGEIVARIRDRAVAGQRTVSVEDMVTVLGRRSYGPFLFVPGLIGITPLSGIPMVPAILAVIVAVFAIQIVLGRSHLWLPGILARRSFDGAKVADAMARIEPVAGKLDRWFYGRLPGLTGRHGVRVAAVMSVLLAVCVPFFEMVPFAGIAPMSAIAAFGLAILVRDGALMLAAIIITVAAMTGFMAVLL